MARWPLFFFASLVAALLFDFKAIYVVFYTTLLLHVAGGWLLQRAVERVRAHGPPGRTYLFPDESAQVRLCIENPSRTPITWLYVQEHAPAEYGPSGERQWVLSLGPRSEELLTYPVRGGRRGVYTLGPLELVAGDAFGLKQRTRTLDVYHDVVVYPNLYAMEELGLSSDLLLGRERVRRPLHPDPTRLAGVRHYEPGDPMRWVHWKATAKSRALQVKQFEHTIAGEALLLLNLNSEEYPAATWVNESELAIATAASLAHRLAEGRERFGFAANARLLRHRSAPALERLPQALGGEEGGIVRLAPRRGRAQLMRVLEVLAAAACKPAPRFAQLVLEATGGLPWGSAVLMVVPSVSEEVRERALHLKAAGYRVLLFVTGARESRAQDPLDPGVGGVKAYRVEYTAAGRLKLSSAAL